MLVKVTVYETSRFTIEVHGLEQSFVLHELCNLNSFIVYFLMISQKWTTIVICCQSKGIKQKHTTKNFVMLCNHFTAKNNGHLISHDV